jgi:hypothetical protein
VGRVRDPAARRRELRGGEVLNVPRVWVVTMAILVACLLASIVIAAIKLS